jgi:hypothetical protein
VQPQQEVRIFAVPDGIADLPQDLLEEAVIKALPDPQQHVARSDAQDKALLYLELAGDRAREQGASAAAPGYYRELVDRLDGLARVLDGARVCEKLGDLLAITARYEAALDGLDQAAERYRAAGALESLGRVTAGIGRVHFKKGTPEEGIAHLQPVVGALEARGPFYIAVVPSLVPPINQVRNTMRPASCAPAHPSSSPRPGHIRRPSAHPLSVIHSLCGRMWPSPGYDGPVPVRSSRPTSSARAAPCPWYTARVRNPDDWLVMGR